MTCLVNSTTPLAFQNDDGLGFDLTGNTEFTGDVVAEARDTLSYHGDTVCEYIIVPSEDRQQRNARLTPTANWQDLRDQPASKLPKPISPLHDVWEVTRAVDKPLYLESRNIGMTYLIEGGKAVLTNAIPLAFFDLSDIYDAIFGPPAPLPPCPSSFPISGSGSVQSPYYTTRAAAAAKARAMVPGQASTEAGLERNGFVCPNPACTTKTLGPVTNAITSVDTDLSIFASFLYFEWRYTARATFTWASSVTCS